MSAMLEVAGGAKVRPTARKYGMHPARLGMAYSIFREILASVSPRYYAELYAQAYAKEPFAGLNEHIPLAEPRNNADLQAAKPVKRPTSAPQRHRRHAEPRNNAALRAWLYVIFGGILGGIILGVGIYASG